MAFLKYWSISVPEGQYIVTDLLRVFLGKASVNTAITQQ
jgi:hypothetical protein